MTLVFYLDEDSSDQAVVRGLAAHGIVSVRAVDAGTTGWPDEDQLAFAAARGYVLVTGNRGDFMAICWRWIAERRSHAGVIVYGQQQYSRGEFIRRIRRVFDRYGEAGLADRLLFLSDFEDPESG